MSPDIFLNFVLALLLGGLVGLERNMPSSSELVRQERDGHIWEESEIGGAGSYALLAFFGALMVWVDQILGLTFWVIMGFVVIAVMILI